MSIWIPVKDADPRARALFLRHYSAYHYRDGRRRTKFIGPGQYLALLTITCDALVVWRKFIDKSGQQGVNCSVFRNEGILLSSEMIKEAMELAWAKWPCERLYTYINPRLIRSVNPGYCFKMAGWDYVRDEAGKPIKTKKANLMVMEFVPEIINA